jgi:hypothetical protein
MSGQSPYDLGVRTLTKQQVESLLNTYDRDPAGSLQLAISSLLDTECSTWESMTTLMPQKYTASGSLARQETSAMDDLVKQLVEHRSL